MGLGHLPHDVLLRRVLLVSEEEREEKEEVKRMKTMMPQRKLELGISFFGHLSGGWRKEDPSDLSGAAVLGDGLEFPVLQPPGDDLLAGLR